MGSEVPTDEPYVKMLVARCAGFFEESLELLVDIERGIYLFFADSLRDKLCQLKIFFVFFKCAVLMKSLDWLGRNVTIIDLI